MAESRYKLEHGIFVGGVLSIHSVGLYLSTMEMHMSGPMNFNWQYPIGYSCIVLSTVMLLWFLWRYRDRQSQFAPIGYLYAFVAVVWLSIDIIKSPPTELTGGGVAPSVWPAPIESYYIGYGSVILMFVCLRVVQRRRAKSLDRASNETVIR